MVSSPQCSSAAPADGGCPSPAPCKPDRRAALRGIGLAVLSGAGGLVLPGTPAVRNASAQQAAQGRLFAATGTVQAAFTPGDPIDEMLIGIIDQARHQVLVQIFSFTHRRIARALVDAHRRGVRVEVIADDRQDRQHDNSVLSDLVRNGIPVFLDSDQSSAHNKIIIVDTGTPQAVLVTGSYNFTWSAQRRNAENVLILRANPALADAFADNWQRLRSHALPYRRRDGTRDRTRAGR
jgi:phosphatidylserine/phosphatidylglycerophosphate/cardiolipin synthase-like enzyme